MTGDGGAEIIVMPQGITSTGPGSATDLQLTATKVFGSVSSPLLEQLL